MTIGIQEGCLEKQNSCCLTSLFLSTWVKLQTIFPFKVVPSWVPLGKGSFSQPHQSHMLSGLPLPLSPPTTPLTLSPEKLKSHHPFLISKGLTHCDLYCQVLHSQQQCQLKTWWREVSLKAWGETASSKSLVSQSSHPHHWGPHTECHFSSDFKTTATHRLQNLTPLFENFHTFFYPRLEFQYVLFECIPNIGCNILILKKKKKKVPCVSEIQILLGIL